MNSLTSQDFVAGVNWDALSSASFADFKANVENAKTKLSVDGTKGIGLVIYTVDTAVGVPDVPNPEEGANFNKWKLYFWARCPHDASNVKRITVYAWNAAYTNDDNTLLRWFDTSADLTAVTALINSANNDSTEALDTANDALTAAAGAQGSATTALTNSNDAVTAAANAQTNAASAQVSATAALNQATAAVNSANAAQATANSAVTAATANKTLAQIVSGLAGQKTKVNDAGTSLIYYNEIDIWTRVCNLQLQTATNVAAGQGAGAATSGAWRDLTVNRVDSDTGNQLNAALAGNVISLKAGTYYVNIKCPCKNVTIFQTRLYDNTNAAMLLKSMCINTTQDGLLIIDGIITLAAVTALKIQYQIFTTQAALTALGVGSPFDPDGSGNVTNRYLIADFFRIN